MFDPGHNLELPPVPAKRYFTIGEVSELCAVKPHVLRYWEQEFQQLKPVTRRGNRRYYQHKDIDLIRQIRALLYQDGYTISGARAQIAHGDGKSEVTAVSAALPNAVSETTAPIQDLTRLRKDLEAVLGLLR